MVMVSRIVIVVFGGAMLIFPNSVASCGAARPAAALTRGIDVAPIVALTVARALAERRASYGFACGKPESLSREREQRRIECFEGAAVVWQRDTGPDQ